MDILKYRGLDYSDFRVPGEFEPQEAVILGWPEMAECIKGYSLHKAFAQLIKIIVEQAEGVTVYVNSPDHKRVESCKKALAEEEVDIDKVVITTYPDGSNWTRDYGPDIMVDDKGHRLLANPRFNMYGQSTIDSVTSTLCAKFAPHLALELGCRDFINSTLITEGGDKEFNGNGVLMALRDTEVNKRNPHMSTEEVEAELKRLFNLKKVLWLEKGVFDDELTTSGVLDYVDGEPVYRSSSANGHTDEFARFVGKNKILLTEITEEEAAKLNSHRITKERCDAAYEVLKNATDAEGNPFEIIRMPAPEPFYVYSKPGDWINDTWSCRYGEGNAFLDDGTPMPTGDMIMQPALSYINFLILNNIVIAQNYWEEGRPESIREKDKQAVEILQKIFPDRKIVPFVSTALNIRGGGVHCATKNIPKAEK